MSTSTQPKPTSAQKSRHGRRAATRVQATRGPAKRIPEKPNRDPQVNQKPQIADSAAVSRASARNTTVEVSAEFSGKGFLLFAAIIVFAVGLLTIPHNCIPR